MKTQTIPRLTLGSDGLDVGVQGLGCMGMSEFYGTADPASSVATLERALEQGVSLFDTADMYGRGENERFLAPFFARHRDDVTIATKFGAVRADDGTEGIRNDPAYIHEAIDASLHRLGVDHVDLYYMHRRDPAVPLSESIGAMAELVTAGKVRHIGLSEVTAAELRDADKIHPVTAVQSEWSVFTRDIETSVVPAAAELGIGVVAYAPLGRGMLTGKLSDATALRDDDVRAAFPRFSGENGRRNAALVRSVIEIATAHNATPAQIALAWLHGQTQGHGVSVVPIPGTRHPARLDENLAALDIALTADDLSVLDSLSIRVAGDRYPDMGATAESREADG